MFDVQLSHLKAHLVGDVTLISSVRCINSTSKQVEERNDKANGDCDANNYSISPFLQLNLLHETVESRVALCKGDLSRISA